jgi:DNA invertase Pin-like site-specific DNA recombinase
VAIYARVSTGEQSPELQLRELRDDAGHRGFVVHREYVDQTSGDVRRRQRAPEFDALMADPAPLPFDLPAYARPPSPAPASKVAV